MTFASPDRLRARRAALHERCPGITFVLPAARATVRNRTVHHPHRQDSDFLYLTGIDAPDACLVLRADGASVLYAPAPDTERERWDGPMQTHADAAAASAIDDVRELARLDGDLLDHVRAGSAVGYRLGKQAALDARMLAALDGVARGRRSGLVLPSVHDPHGPIAMLRIAKDADEVARIRASATLSASAHVDLMESAREGDSGLALAARFEWKTRAGGAARMAYNPIVARGEEAVHLHGSPTRTPVRAGELVLVDAGCELDGYASDVTRTWPVKGGFEPAQAALYDAVLEAQLAGIEAVKVGATLRSIHEAAKAVLGAAATRLGLPGELSRWFPHGTGHWLGLDVHDPGPIDDTPLAVGMVFTVEPGLYVPKDASDAPAELRGIGIRIEDTVVVTERGAEVLSAAAPKARDEIERQRR